MSRLRLFFHKEYLRSLIPAVVLFAMSIVANFYSGVYANARASNFVDDLILSNIPVLDVDRIFIWGALTLIVFVTVLCAVRFEHAPFILFALATFYFTRAGFVALTHLGPFPDRDVLGAGTFVERFFGGNDLFFSGHTGAPFLMALIYWRETLLRYLFVTWSIVMGVVVLLGHYHYTIDVLSAFFITYGVLHIAERLFPKPRAMFYSGSPNIP